MPEIADKLKTPILNLQVAKEYPETTQSDAQCRDRFWQVVEDTVKINWSCELGDKVGSFGAGAAANKIADSYMDEMVETEITKNLQEELNLEIFKTVSLENNLDPKEVRETGVIREFVPEYMKENICTRPGRNERPLGWDSSGGLEEDGGIFAKYLGWLGCCFGTLSPNSYYELSTMCPSEL